MLLSITRKIEFDAGHRIPDHASKCRNAHGHRYVLEATFSGGVINAPGETDNGMVADFSDLKGLMMKAVGEPWDHAFLVYQGDTDMRHALKQLGPDHKTVVMPFVPTVENLVQQAAGAIKSYMSDTDVKLAHVRLYETPNCWADWYED